MLFNGHFAFWPSETTASSDVVWVNARQIAMLVQFSKCPQLPDQAAANAGLEFDDDLQELVERCLRSGVLRMDSGDDAADSLFHFSSHNSDLSRPYFVSVPNVLSAPAVASMAEQVLASPLNGRSPLSLGFARTTGFGVRFRLTSLAALLRRISWSKSYFDLILDPAVFRRLGVNPSAHPNAFYFNALVIPPGGGTSLHVDRTLDGRTVPVCVSVLYLQAAAAPVGRLYLYDGIWLVGLITPIAGMMVHFRGDLKHGVASSSPSDGTRISLVCEQYALAPEELEEVPDLEIDVPREDRP